MTYRQKKCLNNELKILFSINLSVIFSLKKKQKPYLGKRIKIKIRYQLLICLYN
jgi:hypothetical protein